MHILFTNNTLEVSAGTEFSVREAAGELMRRGHRVSAFSSQVGALAAKLAESGVSIVTDLGAMADRPDVIHGHHEWESSLAALRWPESALISFRRGIDPWQEAPCMAPWTGCWVAVDQPCLRHLIEHDGVPKEKAELLLNGIVWDDLQPRQALPERPEKALVLSNYASEDNYLPALREACREEGIQCEVIGRAAGNAVDGALRLLPDYHLVFAKGRSALEAVGAGCGVIVCDLAGIGEVVTRANFSELRAKSFYYGCDVEPVTVSAVRQRISKWDPAESIALAAEARATCSLRVNVDALEKLYARAAEQHRPPSAEEIASFATRFLADKGLAYKLGREIQVLYRTERALAPPADPESATVEMNRCLNYYRKGRDAATGLTGAEQAPTPARRSRRWFKQRNR